MTQLHAGAPTTASRRPDAAADQASPSPRLALLAVAGLVVVAGTAWFAWSLPATASRMQRSSVALADDVGPWRWLYNHAAPPASTNGLGASILAVSGLMFAAWGLTIAVTWQRSSRAAVRMVVGLAALGVAVSLVALPNQTSDIYDYVLFGRVAAVNGGQPYQDLPDAYPEDPTYPYSSHRYTGRADNKLPAWTVAATSTARVAGDGPVTNLLVFRALLGAASVATTALIAWILGRLRPGAAAAGAAAYGLCPVTLVYGTSKTDSLMVLLMVAAIALVVVGRSRVASVAGALAVLVKMIAAPVLVLLVVLPPVGSPSDAAGGPRPSRRRAILPLLGRAAIALAVAALVYAPFRRPLALARTHLTDSSASSDAVRSHPLAVVLFALVLAGVAVWSWRSRPTSELDRARLLIAGAAPVLLLFAVVLTRPSLPWYLLTPLAVVALARSVWMLTVLGAVCAASFVMGWWSSIDTQAHPLPELPASRPVLMALLAAVAVVTLVAARFLIRRRGVEGPPPSTVSALAHRLSPRRTPFRPDLAGDPTSDPALVAEGGRRRT